MAQTEAAETLALTTQELADVPLSGVAPAAPAAPTAREQGRPRLVITQMVLEDFKSYAGRQTIGPFHK
ncbi:Structural maintenance of chromosomes protein 4, partial [Coemansia helicoidea]